MTEDVPLAIADHDSREPPGDETRIAFTETKRDPPDAEPEAGDEDVEPVELLVQLAKDGEIDPWDIDIVAVTDKFLAALDDGDLRTSGRALFYASTLLRMKSDDLFASDDTEEESDPPWEAAFEDETEPDGHDPIASLEAEMDRRLERKHARGTPETLDELVRDLREAERGQWWKQSRSYDTSDAPQRGPQELQYHGSDDVRIGDEPTAQEVTHSQHEADIDAVIDDVEDALRAQYEQGRAEVLYAEIAGVGGSRVMTYLALLFLSHRGQIHLDQDDLFGDLWIGRVADDPAEAVATP